MSAPDGPAELPPPPYYAVIFVSRMSAETAGYDAMATRMVELARQQPGFLGLESTRGADGLGITISYWRDEAAIMAWKAQVDHRAAQAAGQARWYADYAVRIARVERAYGGPR